MPHFGLYAYGPHDFVPYELSIALLTNAALDIHDQLFDLQNRMHKEKGVLR